MTAASRGSLAFLVGCVALVTIYLTWWVTYSQIHQVQRFTQLAPGRAAELDDGTIRVLSLGVADELVPAKAGSDPAPADPDSVWVVATVEVVVSRASDRFWCAVDLVSTDGRLWPRGGPDFERSVPTCDTDDLVVGLPYRFEATFMAPRRAAESLAGLALTDQAGPRRTTVLRP